MRHYRLVSAGMPPMLPGSDFVGPTRQPQEEGGGGGLSILRGRGGSSYHA